MAKKALPLQASATKGKAFVGGILTLMLALGVDGVVFLSATSSKALSQEEAPVHAPLTYVAIPPITASINDGVQSRHLRLRFMMQVEGAGAERASMEAMPRIQDAIQVYFRGLGAQELKWASGSLRLQTDLIAVIGRVVSVPVRGVLVQAMVLQ